MRLKYKKLVLALTLGVLCIGFMAFSMMEPSDIFTGKTKEKTQEAKEAGKKARPVIDEKPIEEGNEIQKDIEELIQKYMKARQEVDMDAMAECVTDIGNVDDKRFLIHAEYLEDIRNISCTIMAGAKEDTYQVYVYYECKFFDIDTLAPALLTHYIIADQDGKLKIYTGGMDEETMEYIEQLSASDTVQELTDRVNKKLAEVLQKDEKLRNLNEMLVNDGGEEDDKE